jgi:hypothetical protein
MMIIDQYKQLLCFALSKGLSFAELVGYGKYDGADRVMQKVMGYD